MRKYNIFVLKIGTLMYVTDENVNFSIDLNKN